uniref:General transcription factor 3C polypeptide 5 n=1 Tax=Caenorhabditis tropicalis TaxID=1561998 RepID=A0A1I7THJ2_9PELO
MTSKSKVLNKLMLPVRLRREPFKSMMISKRPVAVKFERKFAIGLRQLGGVYPDFLKIDLPGEIMNNPAHKVGMPCPFSSTLYAPPIKGPTTPLIYYLYKCYNFLDDLTKYDIFRRASHYEAMLGRRKRATDAFRLAGMAVCMNFELRKRREKFQLRGKWRPEYSNYGRRMMESPRVLVAKMMVIFIKVSFLLLEFQKFSQPYFGQIITRKRQDAAVMTSLFVKNLNEKCKLKEKEVKGRFNKFMRHNSDWVKDRLKCRQDPMFVKFNRERLNRTVINRHLEMPWRRRSNQDLFSEFNFLPSHLAFSVQFCRVLKGFRVNLAKEDEVIRKADGDPLLIRVRKSRYTQFPAISVVNYNEKEELQLTIPRIPRRAPVLAPVDGYSSDSAASAASNTPFDFERDWSRLSKERDHRMNLMGDMINKMHPPLIYCNLKGMELKKLRRTKLSEDSSHLNPKLRHATGYLFRKRINFLERTLPCKDDPRILMTPGWKVFATRENPETFSNVARLLKQKSSWVSKHCMSRAATVPRCDKLPMDTKGKNKKLFLVLILPLTLALMIVTFGMISFL